MGKSFRTLLKANEDFFGNGDLNSAHEGDRNESASIILLSPVPQP
jgi:hypothetical protein